MFVVTRNEGFIGDLLMAGMFTAILNDNKVDAVLKVSREDIKQLLDVPLWDGEDGEEYKWRYEELPPVGSFIERTVGHFSVLTGREVSITRRCVPVKMHDEEVPQVDVALGTVTSNWTPYRMWPYFDDLKELMDRSRITWLDMDKENVMGNRCLNVVKKCKLYVGLETGRSHLVSSVGAGKTLILQSGYCDASHWCMYDYAFIDLKVDCSPCKLREGCKHYHKCMKDMTPDIVMGRINSMLAGKPVLALC